MNVESVFSISESSVSRFNRSVKMNSFNSVDHSLFKMNRSSNWNGSWNEVASILRGFRRFQFVAFREFLSHSFQPVRSRHKSLQKRAFSPCPVDELFVKSDRQAMKCGRSSLSNELRRLRASSGPDVGVEEL